ncbi:MAG: class I SAM-dependent methyltransferase [Acidimicrobiales bacterium]|nr:class I SAM-dependent methyltransferase [Acidimicrobiales bacterium]
MTRWSERSEALSASAYDQRWERLEASGHNVHGEADLIHSFRPRKICDAGCGTGRVAIELSRRGFEVVGVDLDQAMLEAARDKAPQISWVLADLASFETEERFDLIALPGNVMIFLQPGTEHLTISNLVNSMTEDGILITGFQLSKATLQLNDYDSAAEKSGLELAGRWATWGRAPFTGGDYVVSAHRIQLN